MKKYFFACYCISLLILYRYENRNLFGQQLTNLKLIISRHYNYDLTVANSVTKNCFAIEGAFVVVQKGETESHFGINLTRKSSKTSSFKLIQLRIIILYLIISLCCVVHKGKL